MATWKNVEIGLSVCVWMNQLGAVVDGVICGQVADTVEKSMAQIFAPRNMSEGEIDFMLIAGRLRAERERCALTQSAVADCVGASKRTVQHWESGASAPTAGDLAAMSLLGFDVRWVVTGSRDYEPPEPLSPEEQVMLLHWRAASRDTRNAALGALVGATAAQGTKQVFHGPVGGVSSGRGVGAGVVHQDINVHKAPKKRKG
jgi:DNA-binding transcriptional regulator YiaG